MVASVQRTGNVSGKTGCEIMTRIKCLNAEGNPREGKRSCRVGSEGRLPDEARSQALSLFSSDPGKPLPSFVCAVPICTCFTMGTQELTQIMYFSAYFSVSLDISSSIFEKKHKETTFSLED